MAEALFDIVNIIAFNRPKEFSRVAQSLAAQDFGDAELHVWLDGYTGSASHERGLPDRTDEVAAIAARTWPRTSLHRFDFNLGVARMYDAAESLALAQSRGAYVLFFEDDLVLSPSYMEGLTLLMVWAQAREDVALVTAHGYAHEYLGDGRRLVSEGLSPVHSLWAYAVKRSHLKERKPFIDRYLKAAGPGPYHRRDGRAIKVLFIEQDVGFVVGTSQDFAKHAALWLHDRVGLTLPVRLSDYIGIDGLHAHPALFSALGYGEGAIAPFDRSAYAALLAKGFDKTMVQALRLIELQNISIRNLSWMLEQQRKAKSAAKI